MCFHVLELSWCKSRSMTIMIWMPRIPDTRYTVLPIRVRSKREIEQGILNVGKFCLRLKGDLARTRGLAGSGLEMIDSNPGSATNRCSHLGQVIRPLCVRQAGVSLLSFSGVLSDIQRPTVSLLFVSHELSWGWDQGLSKAFLKSPNATGSTIKGRPYVAWEPKIQNGTFSIGSWVGMEVEEERRKVKRMIPASLRF